MSELTLLPSPRVPSVSTLGEAEDVSTSMVLEDALQSQFAEDWHCVPYYVVLPDGERLYARIVKRGVDKRLADQTLRHCLGADELEEAGCRIVVRHLMADIDNDSHAQWEEGSPGKTKALAAVDDALEACMTVGFPPTAIYTTRGGLRIMWRLTEEMDAADSEHALAWLAVQLMERCDFYVDGGALDWTRLQRLPCVVRDGEAQHEQDWYHLYLQPDHDVRPNELGRMEPRRARELLKTGNVATDTLKARILGLKPKTPSTVVLGPCPDPEQAEALAWLDLDQRTLRAVAEKLVQNINRDQRQVVQYRQTLPDGHRDTRLTSIVGSLCGAAERKVPEATPELMLGLLAPLLRSLEPDGDTPDWFQCAWDKIGRWFSESLAVEKVEEERAELSAPVTTRFDREELLLRGFRQHNAALAEGLSDEELTELITDMAILGRKPTECYRLTPDGSYFPVPERWARCVHTVLSHDAFPQEVHDRFMWETEKGTQYKDDPKFFDKEAWRGHVHDVRYSARRGEGLTIDTEGRMVLSLAIHQVRGDIEPVYHQKVDDWLRELFTAEWDAMQRYLSFFTFADRALVALVMTGAARTGKTLFMSALGNLFSPEGPVKDMGDTRFNSRALQSPVWVYDESLPTQASNVKRFDAYLRERISGNWMTIERKGIDQFPVQMFPRFVFAANNDMILRKIFGSTDLNTYDQDALSERLLICPVGEEARVKVDKAKAHFGSETALLHGVSQHLMWYREQADFTTLSPEDRFMVRSSETNRRYISDSAIRNPDTIDLVNIACQIASFAAEQAGSAQEGLYRGYLTLQFAEFNRLFYKEAEKHKMSLRHAEDRPSGQLRTFLKRNQVGHKVKQKVRNAKGQRSSGISINLLQFLRIVLPQVDIDFKLTDRLDSHMRRHYTSRWTKLLKEVNYDDE